MATVIVHSFAKRYGVTKFDGTKASWYHWETKFKMVLQNEDQLSDTLFAGSLTSNLWSRTMETNDAWLAQWQEDLASQDQQTQQQAMEDSARYAREQRKVALILLQVLTDQLASEFINDDNRSSGKAILSSLSSAYEATTLAAKHELQAKLLTSAPAAGQTIPQWISEVARLRDECRGSGIPVTDASVSSAVISVLTQFKATAVLATLWQEQKSVKTLTEIRNKVQENIDQVGRSAGKPESLFQDRESQATGKAKVRQEMLELRVSRPCG